jgi:hypothetical protein
MPTKYADSLTAIVEGMTDQQRLSALRYLIGYDSTIASVVIQWTLMTYPSGEAEPLTDRDIQ